MYYHENTCSIIWEWCSEIKPYSLQDYYSKLTEDKDVSSDKAESNIWDQIFITHIAGQCGFYCFIQIGYL